jgi:hypothetical protein
MKKITKPISLKKKLKSNNEIEKENKSKKDVDLRLLFKLVTQVIRPKTIYMEKPQNLI